MAFSWVTHVHGPHPSQQHAGLQRAVWWPRQEVTRRFEMFAFAASCTANLLTVCRFSHTLIWDLLGTNYKCFASSGLETLNKQKWANWERCCEENFANPDWLYKLFQPIRLFSLIFLHQGSHFGPILLCFGSIHVCFVWASSMFAENSHHRVKHHCRYSWSPV